MMNGTAVILGRSEAETREPRSGDETRCFSLRRAMGSWVLRSRFARSRMTSKMSTRPPNSLMLRCFAQRSLEARRTSKLREDR